MEKKRLKEPSQIVLWQPIKRSKRNGIHLDRLHSCTRTIYIQSLYYKADILILASHTHSWRTRHCPNKFLLYLWFVSTTKISQGSLENPENSDFTISERYFSQDIPFKSCCMFPPFWDSRLEGSHSLLHCPWNFNEYCFGLFQEKLLQSKQSVSQDTTERKIWATQKKCCEVKFKNGKKSIGEVYFHIISSMILLLHLFCLWRLRLAIYIPSLRLEISIHEVKVKKRKRKKKSRTERGRDEGVQVGRDLL